MASLIPGYEYDIFISYRQKDNKHDGWVTDFVENLKGELESTFKEEISVYFDINPHDGLMETHDVEASLKDKLKCLIFIPIISRTYCDPKSFAWEHEFKAFVDLASKDQFGLKVKLSNGNVASRVLPVRIHDLDNDDMNLCESVLGGFFRGVEFIYKEPGVDKPLAPDDDERKNLNHTKYRIQIVKVAHAIKEIIQGMMAEPILMVKEKFHREPLGEVKKEEKLEVQGKPAEMSKRKLLNGGIILVVLLIIAAILVYPKIFKRDKLGSSDKRLSIVVMPFQNMANDTIWNIWQDGIQDILTNSLSNSEDLKVRQTESVNSLIQSQQITNYASITPAVAGKVSQKLDAEFFVTGNIKQAGDKIRVNAQVIDSKKQDICKSFQIDGPSTEEMIMKISDSLSVMIRNFLIISNLNKEVEPDFQNFLYTTSPEAYRFYLLGRKAFLKQDYQTAIDLYSHTLALDSDYYPAIQKIASSFGNQGMVEEAKQWCLKVREKRNLMPTVWKIWSDYQYARYFGSSDERIKYLKQLIDINDQEPIYHYSLGNEYRFLEQYNNAIPEFEKALEIYNKWGIKPIWVYNYLFLGDAYHETGQYKKAKEISRKIEQDFPDDHTAIGSQIVWALTAGDTNVADRYIEKLNRNNSLFSKYPKVWWRTWFCYNNNMLDKAEEGFREILSLHPDSANFYNVLAWLLIDKDRNIKEGLELVEKALELRPDDYDFLDTKGWGLYKQGKYKEALELIEKAWNLKPDSIHAETYHHLQEVKKAITGMKTD